MKLSEVKSCIAGYNAIHEKDSIKIQLKSSVNLISVASMGMRKDPEPGSIIFQVYWTDFKEMNIRLNIRTTTPNL